MPRRTAPLLVFAVLAGSACEVVGLGGPPQPPDPTLTIENGVYV